MRLINCFHSLSLIIAIFCLIQTTHANDQLAEINSSGRAGSSRTGAILRRGINARTKPTTTTTTVAPVEEDEAYPEEGDVQDGQEGDIISQEEPSSTTTESPKKVRAGLRPFRSNEDLLAALKKRRQNVAVKKYNKPAEAATVAPSEQTPTSYERKKPHSYHGDKSGSSSTRKRNNFSKQTTEATSTTESVREKEHRPTRKYQSLRGKSLTATNLQDFQSSESNHESVQVKRPRGLRLKERA